MRTRNFILQKNSPSCIENRILDFGDKLVTAIELKNAMDPRWQEHMREQKRTAASAGMPAESNSIVVRAYQGLDLLHGVLS